MARIRTIKPEFWDDEKLASISRDARLLFIGIWNQADDYGVVKGHPSWLKNKIFPYDEIRPADFQKWVSELEAIRAIIPFNHDLERYFFIRTFPDHQHVNRPSETRNPAPPDNILEQSQQIQGELLTDQGGLSEGSVRAHGSKVREGKGKVRDKESKSKYADAVFLTEEEHQELLKRHGPEITQKAIVILNNYIMSKGKNYKSHYHTILGWPLKEALGNGNGSQPGTGKAAPKTAGAGASHVGDGQPYPCDGEY